MLYPPPTDVVGVLSQLSLYSKCPQPRNNSN